MGRKMFSNNLNKVTSVREQTRMNKTIHQKKNNADLITREKPQRQLLETTVA